MGWGKRLAQKIVWIPFSRERHDCHSKDLTETDVINGIYDVEREFSPSNDTRVYVYEIFFNKVQFSFLLMKLLN